MKNKNEKEEMKMMYGEPCHLIKGMLVALLMEGTAIMALIGIGRILANLFM